MLFPGKAIGKLRHDVQRSRGTIRHSRTTDYDVTIGQCVASNRNLPCAFLIRHKTLSDGKVKSKSVCSHSYCMFCPIVVQLCLTEYRGLTSPTPRRPVNAQFGDIQDDRKAHERWCEVCYVFVFVFVFEAYVYISSFTYFVQRGVLTLADNAL